MTAILNTLPWLEWESLGSPIQFSSQEPHNLGLKDEIVSVTRMADLRMTLEVTGMANSHLEMPTTQIILSGKLPSKHAVSAEGIFVKNWSRDGNGNSRIKCSCERLTCFYSDSSPVHITEWITNYSIEPLLASRNTTRIWHERFERKRESLDLANIDMNLDDPLPSQSNANDHFQLSINIADQEYTILVGEASTDAQLKKTKPGFIEYYSERGIFPTEKQRDLIRDALAFSLGRQIPYVGCSFYNRDWQIIRSEAESAYPVGPEYLLSNPSVPPIEFRSGSYKERIGESELSLLVNKIIANNEKFDFRHSLWLSWVAQTSPLDVAPAHFGAAMESLRKRYFDAVNLKSTKLLDNDYWFPICDRLAQVIDQTIVSATPEQRQGLEHIKEKKIRPLNDKSGGMLYPAFFEAIGLNIGDVELTALNERNRSAHGHRYNSEKYKALKKTADALRTLINRVILKLTSSADCYIDYSRNISSIVPLDEKLGGPAGDGKPAIKK